MKSKLNLNREIGSLRIKMIPREIFVLIEIPWHLVHSINEVVEKYWYFLWSIIQCILIAMECFIDAVLWVVEKHLCGLAPWDGAFSTRFGYGSQKSQCALRWNFFDVWICDLVYDTFYCLKKKSGFDIVIHTWARLTMTSKHLDVFVALQRVGDQQNVIGL